jgi:prepilin-type N-terminal cleavage/methylation domain-containing protein
MTAPWIAPRHSTRGFSIVELLVSMVIIGIGVLVLVGLDRQKWRNVASGNHIETSVRLIESYIEKAKVRIKEDPAQEYPPRDTTFSSGAVNVAVTVSTAYDNQPTPAALTNVKRVAFRATWSVNGVADTLNLVTCIAKNF